MRDLNRYVTKKYAADWKEIGLELGLQLDTLKLIKKSNPLQVDDCLENVLEKWLQLNRKGTCTWKMLEVALTNVNRQQLGLDPVDDVYGKNRIALFPAIQV